MLLALLLAPVMAFTSCLEVIDDGSEAVGYLAPVSVAFDLSVDELTSTKALPLPTIESPNEADILFVVKDQNGNVVHSDYGRWEGTLVIPVGNYTVEASYGANAFGSPYFYGSVSGKVGPYENQTLPDINLKVENSLVAVTIKDELVQHFTCETVTFKSGTTTFSGSLGEYCFVPSGRDLSVVLGGKNSMNKPSTFSYQLAKPLARSAYEVICEKASTNWPSISFTSDKIVAWANRIYVTSPADFSGAISSDNKETVVYEAIPSSSSDWSLAKTSVKDNGIPVIKGLDTGTEYKVRARAGVLVSPEVKVTPNFSGLATSAEHTSTSGLLDGTDVTVSFAHASSAVKASIKSWTLNLCKSDGTVLRSGLSIGTTSDGSQITSSTGWPYLPSGQYKVVAGVTMTDGEVVGTEVIFETDKPTFTVSVSAYTSYNKYLDRNLDFANNAANKHTVFERKTNVSISDALLSNTNYSSIRSSSITFNSNSLGTFNTNTKDFGNDANCTSWQNYPFKASMTFDGVTEEASVDCHITGLPYTAAPPSNDSQKSGGHPWTEDQRASAGISHFSWGSSEFYMYDDALTGSCLRVGTPVFNVPSDITITIVTSAHGCRNALINSDVDCKIYSGTQSATFTAKYNKGNYTNYSVNSLTLYPSPAKLQFENSEHSAYTKLYINQVTITYR